MKSLRKKVEGFTLIELLVVITIIGILVGVALPALLGAVKQGKQNKMLQQATGIYKALFSFASDHDGAFPSQRSQDDSTAASSLTTSNDAFMNLVVGNYTTEKPFYNSDSKYCKDSTGATKEPDNKISPASEALKKGENTYAYVGGLSTSSSPAWPIMADGFKQGTEADPTYSNSTADYGGVWEGKKAVVIFVGGDGKLAVPNSQTYKVLRTDSANANMFVEDASSSTPWLTGGKVYNPSTAN